MRIYEVTYAHVKDGPHFVARRVAVRGWATDAIKKANVHRDIKYWKGKLRVESVRLLESTN